MAIQRVGHTNITDKRGSYRQCNHYGRDTVCGTERILVVSGNNILKLSPWKTPCLALVTTHLIFILVLCKATHLIFIYKKNDGTDNGSFGGDRQRVAYFSLDIGYVLLCHVFIIEHVPDNKRRGCWLSCH